MSNSGIPVVEEIGRFGGKILKPVVDVFKPGDPGGSKDLPTRGGPADPEIEKRVTEQFATRKQAIGAAAVAAGAQRSENEADLLGYTTPKRRAASRTLLGGR